MSNLRHLAIAVILLTGAASAQVLGYQNFCQTGGQTVKSQGLNSSTHVQRSYPSCTVTVFLTGTTNKATVFSDNFSTPLSNPFTANTDGSFLFYAGTAFCYDVTISGGNTGDSIAAPFTYTDQCIGSGGGAGGLPPGCTASGVGQISCTGTIPGFIASNGIVPGTLNIANLPVLPPKGTIAVVQNGANSSDCNVGGGSDVHECLWTGTNWVAVGNGGGASGVSSVGLALPSSLFSITNSPVTGVGTLTGAFVTNFAASSVFGNCTASTATPGPCTLVSAMIPAINLASSANGGVTGILPIANGGTATSSTLTGLVRGGNPFTAAEISGDGTTSGSNALSVVAVHFGGTSIPMGTIPTAGQCLEYNGTNITGAVCSGGSGGPTISTNGSNNTSQAVLNFQNPASFNGLSFTYSNPSGGNETFTMVGTLNNPGLTNSSTAVNSQTCALGSTCTIPFLTNSVSNTSQAGINFINPATFNGLTVTFTNPATNQHSFTLGGTLGNAGLTNPSVTVNGQSCVLGATCNVNSGAANPSLAQNNGAGAAISAASAHTVTIPRLCSDSSGSGTIQSCTTSPSFAPVSGDEIIYVSTTSNTAALTVNVNAAGAKSVHKWSGSSVLAAGDLVSNVPVVMIYDGTFWEAQTIGNAPSGGGSSGTVSNCPTIGSNTYYAAGGTTVNCDQSIIDNGSGTLSATQYQTTGTTAGYVALGGSVTNPTLTVNSAGWLGPASASFTAYALQLSSTGPSANNVMLFGAQSGGISPVTFGTVPNAGLTNPSTTVNSQSCVLGSTCAIGYANIAAGAIANGTTATTQATGDSTANVATDSFVTTAVNNAIAASNPAIAVLAASTGSNITGTYSNGVSGIGATFTVTATGAFTLDGVAINTIGQRILLKDQTSGFQNGMYTATVVGVTAVSPVFTRALDYDMPSDINSTGAIPVQSGTANADTSWLLTSTVNAVGSDALTYIQFTIAPTSLVTLTGTQNLTNKTLDGVSPATMAFVDPTSSIQAQLNAKASSSAATTVNGQTCTLSSTCNVNVGATSGTLAVNQGNGNALIAASAHVIATTMACADTSGSSTAQVCTTAPSFTPAAGDCIYYTTTTANTGTGLTLNVNSLGAKSVAKWLTSTTLVAGDIAANTYVKMCYDGTNWETDTIGNAPAVGGGVNNVSNADGTLTISPTSGNVVASIALGHANTWTALQTFGTSISIGGVTAGGATGTGNVVFATSPTLSSPALTTPLVTTINDANGNPFLLSSATASAVDSITITNAATANPATVAIGTSGTDTNISLDLKTKGSGVFKFNGTGTLPTALFPALTGDVTNSAGALATTIAANAVTGAKMANATVTATQLAAQYSKGSCTEVWGGSGTSFALASGDDAVSNNTCYNDSGVTRTITAVKCISDNASNTTTVNPTFGAAGTGTTILSGALTCGNSNTYSSSGTVSNASWTTGTGINPVQAGTLTGTHIAVIVEYTY